MVLALEIFIKIPIVIVQLLHLLKTGDDISHLSQIKQSIFITYCATKQARKNDMREKDGVLYLRIILDFQKVTSSNAEEVVGMMKNFTLSKLDELEIL